MWKNSNNCEFIIDLTPLCAGKGRATGYGCLRWVHGETAELMVPRDEIRAKENGWCHGLPTPNWAPKHHKQWHLTTEILVIAPWWLSARHSFIDAKCRPWSHKSDENPPEGDTKPPGGNNPWELLFSSSINPLLKPIQIQSDNLILAKCQGNDWLLRDSQSDIDKHLCTKSSSTTPFLETSSFRQSLIVLRKVWFTVKALLSLIVFKVGIP